MDTSQNKTYRVWRALDAETSYFGIRGRFLMLFLMMAGIGIIITLIIWNITGDLIGMICGALVLIGCYIAIQNLQNRFTSREFERMLYRWRCVRYLRMRPQSLRSYIKSNDIEWK